MQDRVTFLEKLGDMVKRAKGNDSVITIAEVEEYFPGGTLTEEQMDMVFDYLLSQKIVVKGYLKIQEEAKEELSEAEKRYLEEYERELAALRDEEEGEKNRLFAQIINGDALAKSRVIELYLKEVVEIAKTMRHPEIFLEDLVQEGNVGLILGVEMITDAASAHDTIVGQVRQSIQMCIEEYEDDKARDKAMIQKVDDMDAAITELTEELGRKVTIEELAMHLGMSEDEVMDVLHLTGEDQEEEEQKN